MGNGRSVRLFLSEGTPGGILTAEIVNWTGQILAGPRSKLEVALQNKELQKTGVYVLYGTPLSEELPTVYVGEGDDISKRLSSHSKDESKDFFERFVAITNKDLNLTKAHVRYIESVLIQQLKKAKKSKVANSTEPIFDRLPIADISDMDAFVENINLVLPVIGVTFFHQDRASRIETATGAEVPKDAHTVFVVRHEAKGISARAREIDGEFIVESGARGDLREAASFYEKLRLMREQLFESHRARKISDIGFELVEDVAFSSPSAASVFLFGTSRNGRTDWVLEGTGETYADWKKRLLEISEGARGLD